MPIIIALILVIIFLAQVKWALIACGVPARWFRAVGNGIVVAWKISFLLLGLAFFGGIAYFTIWPSPYAANFRRPPPPADEEFRREF